MLPTWLYRKCLELDLLMNFIICGYFRHRIIEKRSINYFNTCKLGMDSIVIDIYLINYLLVKYLLNKICFICLQNYILLFIYIYIFIYIFCSCLLQNAFRNNERNSVRYIIYNYMLFNDCREHSLVLGIVQIFLKSQVISGRESIFMKKKQKFIIRFSSICPPPPSLPPPFASFFYNLHHP